MGRGVHQPAAISIHIATMIGSIKLCPSRRRISAVNRRGKFERLPRDRGSNDIVMSPIGNKIN